MYDNILWLITARSGSKSIVDKNIKMLGEFPLFYYRYLSAKKISPVENIWGSTDSVDYIKIFNEYGLITPFVRPNQLALDDSSSADVVLHAMNHAEKNDFKKKYIGLLEPTSPFVTSKHLSNAIDALENDNQSKSIVATVESRPHSFFIQDEHKYLNQFYKNLKENKRKLGRQQFTKEITPSGGFYICEWDEFKETKSFYNINTLSFELDEISGLEIDEPIDWEFAEFLIKKNKYEIIK